MEHLDGKLTRVVWRSDDGASHIAQLTPAGGGRATVLGPTAAPHPVEPGLSYRLHGRWVEHPQYGRQFEYAAAEVLAHDEKGVIAYLVGVCPGVGEARARALWAAFGAAAVDTLRDNPALVLSRELLPVRVAQEASQALADDRAWQGVRIDLMAILAGRGFQLDRVIGRCIAHWGHRAPEVIRRNPFALLLKRIPSAGWERCDQLYLDLGHRPDRLKRQALAAAHHLKQHDGDTWVSAPKVGEAIAAKIGAGADPPRALVLARRAGLIAVRRVGEERWVAEAARARDEERIAEEIRRLRAWTPKRWRYVSALRQRLLSETSATGDSAA